MAGKALVSQSGKQIQICAFAEIVDIDDVWTARIYGRRKIESGA